MRRPDDLATLLERTTTLLWSTRLVHLVVRELNVESEVEAAMGPLSSVPARRFPQVVAIAVAARYRWRPDLLAHVTRYLDALPRRVR